MSWLNTRYMCGNSPSMSGRDISVMTHEREAIFFDCRCWYLSALSFECLQHTFIYWTVERASQNYTEIWESISCSSDIGDEVQHTQSSNVVLTCEHSLCACVSQILMMRRGARIKGAVSLKNSERLIAGVCGILMRIFLKLEQWEYFTGMWAHNITSRIWFVKFLAGFGESFSRSTRWRRTYRTK